METVSAIAIKALSGGGDAKGIFVGTVTSASTAFPTTRRDGTALKDEDFVRAGGTTFPFTLGGVTFEHAGQKAFYDSVNHIWVPDIGEIIGTNEVVIQSPSTESLSGDATNQKAINIQNKNEISILGKTFSLTETDADSIRSFTLIVKDRDNHELLNKNLADFILKTRKVAGADLADDITAQEIQDAIKELTATLKNKTINADDNTISNIEVDNFKSSAYNKKGDSLSDDDTHFATSGLIAQREINDTDSSITFDTSGDTDGILFDIVNGVGETVLGKTMDFGDRVVLAVKEQTIKKKTIDCDTSSADKNTIQNLPLSAIANQTTAKAGKKLIVKADGTVGLEATGPSATITVSPDEITEGTATEITITIALTKGDANLATAVLKAGSTTIDTKTDFTQMTYTVSHSVSTSTTFTVTVTDADGLTTEESAEVTAISPIPTYTGYFGGLTTGLSTVTLYSKAYSGTITLVSDKICYKYPASLGNLTSIIGNGMDYSSFFAMTTEEISGVQYYVYTASSASSVTNFQIAFS